MNEKKRKYVGVVIDKSFWEAVEASNDPLCGCGASLPSMKSLEYQVFCSEPVLSMIYGQKVKRLNFVSGYVE